jgi:hypothetical protein
MRIERDWYVFCGKQFVPRRCFSHTDIGDITRASLRTASATVLLYSSDLLPRQLTPLLVRNAFCGRVIELPTVNGVYAMKAALQLFIAANASHSFHGNSYSTFSRGVAMLRRGVRSFAYDCAGDHVRSGTGLVSLNPGQCNHGTRRVNGAMGSLCDPHENCECNPINIRNRAFPSKNSTAAMGKQNLISTAMLIGSKGDGRRGGDGRLARRRGRDRFNANAGRTPATQHKSTYAPT